MNASASISTPTPAAVEFRDVTKRYDDTVALDGVSIDIPIGQTLAMLGPNGAGKSTAISLMLGPASTPRPGPSGPSGWTRGVAVANGRVGALLQTSGLPVTARVGELVAFVRRLYPEPLPLATILERAGLRELERRPVETLSGGEGQRLRFAMAIAGDPDLVFLDEPTVGMDVETRRALLDATSGRFAAEGRTVVFATHYLEEADVAAERIVVLSRGRIVADGTARSIKARVSDRTVTFTLSGATPETLAAIQVMPTVTAVDIVDDRVAIRTTDSDTVMRRLFESGLDIRDLEIHGAGLEDAFIALTSADEPAA